jgi:hypothetical protein
LKTISYHGILAAIKKYITLLFDIRSAFHKNFISFLFFVLLASVFWFFRSLSNVYETEILYPVRYVNLPENKVIVGELPDKLALRVKAIGRKILLSKLNLKIIPLKFDVNSFVAQNSSSDTLYIPTNSVKNILSEELDGIEIIDIKPDTLKFCFIGLVVKKVPVKPTFPDNQPMFAPQYMVNGPISIEPDSIIISGPKNMLQDISTVYTEPLNLTDLSDTVTRFYNIEKHENISYSQRKVRVTVPVDKYTQAEYNLPVVALNLPDNLILKAFPERVRITYNITLSNYKKINPEWIMPHIDYQEILKNPSTRLHLFLLDTPDMIKAIKFSPEKVEYLLTKR